MTSGVAVGAVETQRPPGVCVARRGCIKLSSANFVINHQVIYSRTPRTHKCTPPTSLSLPTAALQIVCLPRQRRRVLLCSNSPPSHPAILLHQHITYPKVSPCPRCCPHSPSAHQCNLFASQLLTSGSTEPSNHGQGTMCRRQNTMSPILTADYRSASTVSVALAASSSATRKFAARPATPPTPPQELTLATTASSTAMLTLSLSTIPSLSPSMLYVYHNRDMRIGAVPGGSLGTEDADG